MKILALSINSILIIYILICRILIKFGIDIYSLRELTTKFTWLIILILIFILIYSILFVKIQKIKFLNISTSIIGIALYLIFYDSIQPW